MNGDLRKHVLLGERCPVCRNHLVSEPVDRCQIEIARALEMDDPRWCLECGRAFERVSCAVTLSAQGQRDLCGRCQGRRSAYRILYGPRRPWWMETVA